MRVPLLKKFVKGFLLKSWIYFKGFIAGSLFSDIIFSNLPKISLFFRPLKLCPSFLIALPGYFLIIRGSSFESFMVINFIFSEKGCYGMSISFIIDWIRIIFVGTVLVIVARVLVYRRWYILNELYYSRFVWLVYLFVLSIVFIICIPNLVSVLIGWDGLGLTSFLLVIYYQNRKSLGAGMLTVLTNRIGDVFILVSIRLMFNEGCWFVYEFLYNRPIKMLSFMLILRAVTKRAQFPYVSWLPAAIAAPTPVSSLVHSSTLVTAGVYLLLRSYNLFEFNGLVLNTLKVLRVFTLMLAGSRAVIAIDLKKIVALSTLSQLRMMMFVVSIGFPSVAFFHLIVHAVFKALLFLSVGAYIHFYRGCQDFRLIGRGWKDLPLTSGAMLIANTSLCGLPFTRGFFSKDLIIELRLINRDAILIYLLEFIGVIFTSLYRVRIMYVVIFGKGKSYVYPSIFTEKINLCVPYWILGLGADILGSELTEGWGSLRLSCYLNFIEKMLVGFIALYRIRLFLTVQKSFYKSNFCKRKRFFGTIWLIERLRRQPIAYIIFTVSEIVIKVLDKGWLEYAGPQGLTLGLYNFRKAHQKAQRKFFISFILFSFVIGVFRLLVVVWLY